MVVEKYISTYRDIAQSIGRIFNICPIFILSVAALESGYGKKFKGNNLFGIKAGKSWKGEKRASSTKEYIKDGRVICIIDFFRVYPTIEESFLDFCKLIEKLYPQCIGKFNISVCSGLINNKKWNYSTSPKYSELLESVYRKIQPYVR